MNFSDNQISEKLFFSCASEPVPMQQINKLHFGSRHFASKVGLEASKSERAMPSAGLVEQGTLCYINSTPVQIQSVEKKGRDNVSLLGLNVWTGSKVRLVVNKDWKIGLITVVEKRLQLLEVREDIGDLCVRSVSGDPPDPYWIRSKATKRLLFTLGKKLAESYEAVQIVTKHVTFPEPDSSVRTSGSKSFRLRLEAGNEAQTKEVQRLQEQLQAAKAEAAALVQQQEIAQASSRAKIEALELELTSVKEVTAKEIQELQERLSGSEERSKAALKSLQEAGAILNHHSIRFAMHLH